METPVLGHVVRPLGILEKYHSCVHALNFYFNITGVARYHISAPNVSNEHIRKRLLDALCEVTSQHSPMCVSIRGENTHSPVFVHVPSIDIPARVTYLDGGDKDDLQLVEKVLEDEHNRPFPGLDDGSGWLWRVIVFEHSQHGWVTVAWVVHHAVSDGIGVKVFHAAFGDALNAPTTPAGEWESAHWTVHPPHDLTLPDPFEKAADISPSYRSIPHLLRAVYELYTPSFMHPKRDTSIYTGPPVPPAAALPTFRAHHRIAVLSARVADALRRTCRAHGTTVSAYLHALLARVVRAVHPGYPAGYAARSPVSGRRFAPGSEAQLVDYVTDCAAVVTFRRAAPSAAAGEQEQEEDWANARKCGAALRDAASRSRDASVGHLVFLADYFAYFRAKLGAPRDAGALKVNSIGLLARPRTGPWEMDRFVHTVCGGVVNAAFVLNVSTVEGGDMGVCVSWGEWEGGPTSRQVGDRVMRGVVEGVLDLLQLKSDLQANVIWTLEPDNPKR